MRFRYVITYDISDGKRLRKVFGTMRNWGDHVQLSVFFSELNDKEKVEMMLDLRKVINEKEDQVLIIRLGPVDGREKHAVETLGKKFNIPGGSARII